MNTSNQQGRIKRCSFELSIHQRIRKKKKKKSWFQNKISSRTTVFKIDNDKKIEQKISILEWCLNDLGTLKTEVTTAENLDLHHRKKYILKY